MVINARVFILSLLVCFYPCWVEGWGGFWATVKCFVSVCFKRKDHNKRKTANWEIIKRDIITNVFSIYVFAPSFTEYLHICARQSLPLRYISEETSSALQVLPFQWKETNELTHTVSPPNLEVLWVKNIWGKKNPESFKKQNLKICQALAAIDIYIAFTL